MTRMMTNFTAADMIIHGAQKKPKKVTKVAEETAPKGAQTPLETPSSAPVVKPTGKTKKA
jgi:hypothetical protein